MVCLGCLLASEAEAQTCFGFEAQHDIDLRVEHGLITATHSIRFVSGYGPAPVIYQLGVPESAHLAALRVCNAQGCRQARAGDRQDYETALYAPAAPVAPFARAYLSQAEDGSRLIDLAAAPVSEKLPITLVVTWVAEVGLHGGLSSLTIPTGPCGAGAVPRQVTLRASGRQAVRLNGTAPGLGPVLVPSEEPIQVEAELPAGARETSAHLIRCGDALCLRLRAAAGPAPEVARDVIVAVDLSPSSMDVTRDHLIAALRLILDRLPAGSRVRLMTFGHGAHWRSALVDPSDVDIESLRLRLAILPVEEPLTEPIAQVGRARGPRALVVVSSGAEVTDYTRVAAAARADGVALSLVNVAPERASAATQRAVQATGGVVVELGGLLDPDSRLRANRRLGVLSAPTVTQSLHGLWSRRRTWLGPLRAGEQVVWEGRFPAGGASLAVDGAVTRVQHADAFVDAALGPRLAREHGAVTDPRTDLVAAPSGMRRVTGKGTGLSVGAGISQQRYGIRFSHGCGELVGVSREVVQRAFANVRPRVRACFRAARRGREAFAARVTVSVVLSSERDPSVQILETSGDVSEELAACVGAAAGAIQIQLPPGDNVEVRYPFATRGVTRPRTVELPEDIALAFDRLFSLDPGGPEATIDGEPVVPAAGRP